MRLKLEDDVKMDLKGTGCVDVKWIQVTQDTDKWRSLVNMVMSLWVPKNVGYLLAS